MSFNPQITFDNAEKSGVNSSAESGSNNRSSQMNLRWRQEEIDLIRKEADSMGLSASGLVRMCVMDYLAKRGALA